MLSVFLLLFPLFSGLACLILPKRIVKGFAFTSSLFSLCILLFAWVSHQSESTMALGVDWVWISGLGIHFKLGLDGISILLVFLTNLSIPIIIATSFTTEYPRANLFYFLMLFMQAGLVGVFTAMDGFLFYVAWEAALIPIYFICGLWGGADRIRITLKFFIYTISGSLFMLMGILYLYLQTAGGSFDLHNFYALNLSPGAQNWVFLAFFLAFAIKIPIFPFHTWQPDSYTDAPPQGSMLLGGIMLKMGLYGIVRWLLPICPEACKLFGPYVIGLSIAGILYASVIAFMQQDMKRLIAYSSIAHVGLISAALFINNFLGFQGGMIQLVSHGLNIIGLFFIVSIIQKQSGTRDLGSLGGIAAQAPVLAVCFLILVLGAVALPLTNGFIGEFLMLGGLFQYNLVLSVLAGSTLIFGAVYFLKMFQKVMLGPTSPQTHHFQDVEGSDRIVLLILSGLVILIGVYPKPILQLTQPAITELLLQINNKLVIN